VTVAAANTLSSLRPKPLSMNVARSLVEIYEADGRLSVRAKNGRGPHKKNTPNNLEVNWGAGNKFHLETLTAAVCFADASIDATPDAAQFNTLIGTGTGAYNGLPGAVAQFTFTDAGEPGQNDTAKIVIKVGSNSVLSAVGTLNNGNQQAHAQ